MHFLLLAWRASEFHVSLSGLSWAFPARRTQYPKARHTNKVAKRWDQPDNTLKFNPGNFTHTPPPWPFLNLKLVACLSKLLSKGLGYISWPRWKKCLRIRKANFELWSKTCCEQINNYALTWVEFLFAHFVARGFRTPKLGALPIIVDLLRLLLLLEESLCLLSYKKIFLWK